MSDLQWFFIIFTAFIILMYLIRKKNIKDDQLLKKCSDGCPLRSDHYICCYDCEFLIDCPEPCDQYKSGQSYEECRFLVGK